MNETPYGIIQHLPRGQRRIIPLPRRRFSIGRRRDNDLCIESEPTVSRYHAELLPWSDRLVLRDLGSTFGTFVNGRAVREAVLHDGDEILLGKAERSRLVVEIRERPEAARLLDEMRRVLHITRILSSSLDLQEVLEMVMQAIIEVSGAERGALLLFDDDQRLQPQLAMDHQGHVMPTFDLSKTVVDEVVRTGRPVVLDDVAADGRFAAQPSVVGMDLKRIMCLPLRVPRSSPEGAEGFRNLMQTPTASVHLETPSSLIPVSSTDQPTPFTQTVRFRRLAEDTEMIGVVYVDSTALSRPFERVTYELLQALVSHAAVALNNSRLVAQRRAWQARLESLVEAARTINSTLELDEVLASILEIVTDLVGAERGKLTLLDEGEPPEGGWVAAVVSSGRTVICRDCSADERFVPDLDELEGFETRDLLAAPVRNKDDEIIGVLEVRNKREGSFGPDDARALEAFTTHAALAIENALLYRDSLAKRRLDQELDLAGEIQRRLLPDRPPKHPRVRFAARNVPSIQVGGDYYDFPEPPPTLTPPDQIGIAIGDIAGKGIPAAIQMGNLRATVRAQFDQLGDLPTLMDRVNRAIFNASTEGSFATLFVGLLDCDGRVLRYSNGGHNPPYLVRASGAIERLTVGGPLIGVLEGIPYEEGRVELAPGDIIVLFTDGLTEAQDVEGELFGEERLEAVLRGLVGRDADEVLEALFDALWTYEDPDRRSDDVTVVVVSFPPERGC